MSLFWDRLRNWLEEPATGLGYGIAVAIVVFGVLAGLLVTR